MGNSTANTSIEWQKMMKQQAKNGPDDDMMFGQNNMDDLDIDNESLFYQAKVKFQHKQSFSGTIPLQGGAANRSTANAAALEISQYQDDILAIVELDIEEVDDRLEELEYTIGRLKEQVNNK